MKEVISQIKSLAAGDLVQVQRCDASIGKSLSNGVSGIDVPVKSWGVFIGLLGQKMKHVILAQNCFRYNDGLYDIDYTAVPIPWTTNVAIIIKAHVCGEEAANLLNSFLLKEKMKDGKSCFNRCSRQERVRNH